MHEALSFDRLHAYHSGLFGHHLFEEFKGTLEGLGRDAQESVDNKYVPPLFFGVCDLIASYTSSFSLTPRWPNLNHFSRVTNVRFTDATKYEDISKVSIVRPLIDCSTAQTLQIIVPAAQSVLTRDACEEGHQLLILIRKWVELDMYLSFEVQTEKTIAAFEETLQEYEYHLIVRRSLFYLILLYIY